MRGRVFVFAKPSLRAALPPLKGHWSVESLGRSEPPPRQPLLDALRRVIGEGPHREAWRRLRASKGAAAGRTSRCGQGGGSAAYSRRVSSLPPGPCRLSVPAIAWPSRRTFLYVMAVHDLQHRLQPEFPEVSADGEWEWREYLFPQRHALRDAAARRLRGRKRRHPQLSTDPTASPRIGSRFCRFCRRAIWSPDVSESERQRVRSNVSSAERYLFYPAQFWPHKNHTRIVQALGLLKQAHGADIPIAVLRLARRRHPRAHISARSWRPRRVSASNLRHTSTRGYVPDEDMSGLYAGAVALTMPTFFGPTNIPVLEAWAYGCPVLTSDIRGIREQVGDAGVLVDPRSDRIHSGRHLIGCGRNDTCREPRSSSVDSSVWADVHAGGLSTAA